MEKIQLALMDGNIPLAMQLWSQVKGSNTAEVYEFGRTLFSLYFYAEAELVLSKLLTEGTENYLLSSAKLWFGLGRFEISARYSARALELHNSVENVAMHASNLVRSGKLDQAEQILLVALKREPAHGRTVRLLAHVERTTGRQEQAKDRIKNCLLNYPSSENWRLEYELGYILDRLGDYIGAFQVMERAKAALKNKANKLIPEWKAKTSRQWQVSQLLDTNRLEQWANFKGGEDTVIMAGFPRSGTTLLENILSTHDRCLGTDETGVLNQQFIDPIILAASTPEEAIEELDDFHEDELAAGRAEYYRCTEAVIDEQRNSRILLEKEPLMTADLALPLRLFPQCKILMPLRDPRDVVISFYFTIVPLATNSVGSISLELACKYYSEIMRHWLLLRDRLPQKRWMESRYEDLLSDTEGQTRKLSAFLGVEWSPEMLEHHKHASSKAVTTPTYSDVSKALYTRSRERWRNYKKELNPHLHYLEPYIEAFGYEL